MKSKNPLAVVIGWFALALAPNQAGLAADASPAGVVNPSSTAGSITGQVSNANTQAFLEGAVVELVGTGQATTTDREGRYQLSGPAGDALLTVSFTGLDTVQVPVTIESGRSVVRHVALTADIYRLEAFNVEGAREGSALAITLQRQSPNVKNVVATDAFGTMTEDNVGQFLQRLPGLTADFSTGSVREVMVRGISASLNTVEMDGIQLANTNSSGTNRFFDFLQASISMIESIEVTKAPTPDRPANSIGGTINMVTRSAFGRNQPRIFTYSIGLVHAIDRIGGRGEHWDEEPIKGLTPSLSFSYADVFGRNRNLGVSLSFSRNSIFGSSEDTLHNYQATLERPAYIYQTNTRVVAVGGPHTRQNTSLKFEYKLSDRTTLSLNTAHNMYVEVNDTRGHVFATQNAAARFAPGYSEVYSEALPHSTTRSNITSGSYDNISHNYRFQPVVVHRLGDTVIDYSATYSKSAGYHNYSPYDRQYSRGAPKATLSITGPTNIGWIIDRRQDPVWPTITQTAGPDAYDLNNYTAMTLTQNNRVADASIVEGRFNFQRKLDMGVPVTVKAGLQYQQQRRDKDYRYYQWTYTGPGGLGKFADTHSWTRKRISGIRQGPWADMLLVAQHKEDHPEEWTENLNYRYTQRLMNLQDFRESIASAYVMGTVQLNALTTLGGLRVEDTRTLGNGPLQQSALTAEEQARRAAWVGPLTEEEIERRAVYQWGNRTRSEGQYRNVFPGVHFKYSHRSGLVARASYSTSIGRPPLTSIIPNTNVNDEAQTISASNTALQPQFSDNFDLNFEYYFEPIGLFSASLFLKEVSSFIFTDSGQFVGSGPDNGFDGLYEGYRLTTQRNGGSARYRGFELSYQQQFTFLPGFWKGFGVNMNYTQLETRGDYGGAVATTQVAGFRPKTGNVAVTYQQGRYRASIQANWVDTYLVTVSANPALITYQAPRTFTSVKLTYRLTNRLNLYLNWDNIFREPTNSTYFAYKDRVGTTRLVYPTIGAGVQGRF